MSIALDIFHPEGCMWVTVPSLHLLSGFIYE